MHALELQIHPARLVGPNGEARLAFERSEFHLLSAIIWRADQPVSSRELQWHIWKFDEARETMILGATRRRLVEALKGFAPDIGWEDVVRREPKSSYGLFLAGT